MGRSLVLAFIGSNPHHELIQHLPYVSGNFPTQVTVPASNWNRKETNAEVPNMLLRTDAYTGLTGFNDSDINKTRYGPVDFHSANLDVNKSISLFYRGTNTSSIPTDLSNAFSVASEDYGWRISHGGDTSGGGTIEAFFGGIWTGAFVVSPFLGDYVWGTRQTVCLAGSWQRTTDIVGVAKMYVNGVLVDTDTALDTDAIDNNWNDQGIQVDFAFQDSDNIIDVAFAFNRALTDEEQWWLSNNPYGLFMTRPSLMYPLGASTIDQKSHRFYADGTESGSSVLADIDANITIAKQTTFQLREGGQTTGDKGAETAELQYRPTGVGSWISVEDE